MRLVEGHLKRFKDLLKAGDELQEEHRLISDTSRTLQTRRDPIQQDIEKIKEAQNVRLARHIASRPELTSAYRPRRRDFYSSCSSFSRR